MQYKNCRDLFLVYLEAKGDSVRTITTYEQRIRLFLFDLEISECEAIEKTTPEMVDRWVVIMRRRGLAPDTIRSRVRDMKHFFRWCENRGYLVLSPAKHLNLKGRARLVVKSMKPVNLQRILGAAGYARDEALIRFIASTGCRAGEAAGLMVSDLDLVKREAAVCGKTGPRFVDFDQETAVSISAWLAVHPRLDCGFVFVGLRSPHRPVTSATIYQVFRRIALELEIESERFNPHSIRHLVGKTWVEQTNLELARQKLGHADISTTAAYANQDRDQVKHFTEEIKIF